MSNRKKLTLCCECDDFFDHKEMNKVKDDYVCDDCVYEEYFFCYNCNTITNLKDMCLSEDDDDVLCIDCRINEDYVQRIE